MARFGGTNVYKPSKTIKEYAYRNEFETSDGRLFNDLERAKRHQEKIAKGEHYLYIMLIQ